MYNLPFTGNLTEDPRVVTNSAGKRRAIVKIAVNEGERGTDSEKTHYLGFSTFDSLADNVAASLKKGDRVNIIARLNTFKKTFGVLTDGEFVEKEITQYGFTAKSVSPDLNWATAKVSKVARQHDEDAAVDEDEAPRKSAPAPRKAPVAASKPVAARRTSPAVSDDDF
ncbi:MAG: single-stranded DNA-binding protein [Acidobacteria bacterium]|nr:single-stranded DNA-binding protein [Acidobacteriota bacterium]